MWKIKQFDELTTDELFEILRLRVSIFVVEQERIYQEIDEVDKHAIHVFKWEDGRVIAYARVFKENDVAVFGRVGVKKSFRGNGLANELMENIFDVLNSKFKNDKVKIIAQTEVQRFYEKWGFTVIGEPYIHEHTPHIDMQLIK